MTYDVEIIARVKELPGRSWSQSKKCWHVPDTAKSLRLLQELGGVLVDTSPEKPANPETKAQKQSEGKHSARSAQAVLKRAVKKAKITKKVTLHTLRHSFVGKWHIFALHSDFIRAQFKQDDRDLYAREHQGTARYSESAGQIEFRWK